MESKMLAPHPADGTHHRGTGDPLSYCIKTYRHAGYSAPGVEKVAQNVFDPDELVKHRAKAPDVKESFESGREDDPAMPNIWPPEGVLPGFKEACLDFYWVSSFSALLCVTNIHHSLLKTCHDTELNILRVSFHLPEEYFLQYHTLAENQLRLLHYPR